MEIIHFLQGNLMKFSTYFPIVCLLFGSGCNPKRPERPSFAKSEAGSDSRGKSPTTSDNANPGSDRSESKEIGNNSGSKAGNSPNQPAPIPGSFAVGLVTFALDARCTATIIKHGVALTAKHCFTDKEIEPNKLGKIMISFPAQSLANAKPLAVRGDQIKKVIFDGPNDIAYILYNPGATNGLTLDLPHLVSADGLSKGKPTKLIGFPVEESPTPLYPKVERGDCSFTGKKGTIPPAEDGPRYDGMLYENDCKAWWGMSGGPVLDMSDVKNPKVIGVISHTFNLTEEGDINPEKIESDQYGKFIKGTAISPLTEAKQLNSVLQMDPAKLPTPTVEKDVSKFCGYSSMNALLADARKALDYLKTAKSVSPFFWSGTGFGEAEGFIRKDMEARNAQYKSEQSKVEAALPYMKDVYADYYSLFDSPYLAKFKELGMFKLGLINEYSVCPALGCTQYITLTIQGYQPEIEAFQKAHSTNFRPIMKKVLAHEIGHYVWDHYILVSKIYSSPEEATSKQDPLKNHLVVDAIGSILAGSSPLEFQQIFDNMKSTVHGVTDFPADFSERNFCFSQLK